MTEFGQNLHVEFLYFKKNVLSIFKLGSKFGRLIDCFTFTFWSFQGVAFWHTFLIASTHKLMNFKKLQTFFWSFWICSYSLNYLTFNCRFAESILLRCGFGIVRHWIPVLLLQICPVLHEVIVCWEAKDTINIVQPEKSSNTTQ